VRPQEAGRAGSTGHTPHEFVRAASDAFTGAAAFLIAAFVLVAALVRPTE
jgi:hypothetical protein